MIYFSDFGTGVSAGNPNFANNVIFLSGFNGTDGATTAVDEATASNAPHSFTSMSGNAQLDTGVKKFGASSLMLDGSGDCATWADNGDWDLGDGGQAIQFEAQVCFHASANLSAQHTIVSQYNATGSQRSWVLWFRGDLSPKRLQFAYTTAGVTLITMVEANWTPVADSSTFYSICMSRVGTTARLFIDGVIVATNTDNGNPHNGSSALRVGGVESGGSVSSSFHGWIDEVRISKEIVADGSTGFNVANYTPQTSEFPRS